MTEPFSMIILAGGESRRMGTDKADLRWQGKTFLQMQIEKGRALGISDIQVSGYRGSSCPIAITPDRFPGRGPLAGIEACLRRAKHSLCLVVSVDAPFVPDEALRALLCESRSQDTPVTIVKAAGREQPLIGIYSSSLADAMAEELKQGKGSVFAFLNKVGYGVHESLFPDIFFSNINSPEQYQGICIHLN